MRIGQMDASSLVGATGSSGVKGQFAIFALKKANEAQKKAILTLIQSMPIPKQQKSNLIDLLA